MKLIKIEDLKAGMRLAKPIYNKDGVFLFDRGNALNDSAIRSISQFGLWGVYVLEPAEPLPPMSEEELEFERFQIVSCFTLKTELDLLANNQPTTQLVGLVKEICERYGNLNHKISFIQGLRSPSDHIYKHCLNVAILSAMIANKLSLDSKEKEALVYAALYHDVGKLYVPEEILYKPDALTIEELKYVHDMQLKGYYLIQNNYMFPSTIRRYIIQLASELLDRMKSTSHISVKKYVLGTQILRTADFFDILTAMRTYKEPLSEYSAVELLLSKTEDYDEHIIDALIDSIYVLPVGACVELSDKSKGLVIRDNKKKPLRPLILCFNTNRLVDLDSFENHNIKINGIMKTMDNRFEINREMANSYNNQLN